MQTLAELQAKIATATDPAEIEAIAQEIVRQKADRRKVEAEAAIKEAEAMAGEREKLSIEIHKAVKQLGFDKLLREVKAWGFTYKVNKANPAEPDVDYKAVSLSTQQIRAHKAGHAGSSGKTLTEYGLSLDEVWEKFSAHWPDTDYVGAFAKAEAQDIKHATEHGLSTPKQSNRWRVKDAVKRRALAENLLAPTK